jgi:hypothetical protein
MAKPKPEQELQNEGRLCIGSLPFVRLYRNNVGTLTDRNGTPVSYGLAVGSADTIGIVAPHGCFLSIEWKRPGWKPPTVPPGVPYERLSKALQRHVDQCNWRDQINAQGGVAGFASVLTEGLFLVHVAMRGLSIGSVRRDDPETVQWVLDTERQFHERMAERGKRKTNRDR